MSKKGKVTREYLETLSKEQVIDLCLQFMFDSEVTEKQLDQANERLKGVVDRPKFKHFEEYWYIENNPYCDNELQVFNGKVMEILVAYDEDYLYEYRFDTSCRYIEENMIFETLIEAQKKLQELRGGE